ncbi:MAG: hypothetical protein WCY00_00080 [Candidatus Dojkabacteria bacterium]|jgi:hypothetical protein
MNYKRVFFTIFFVLFLIQPFCTKAYANRVFPYKTEILISNQERTKEQFSFRNEGKKDIKITPIPYSFDPKEVEIKEGGEIFVRVDKEIFTVKSDETAVFDFEIIPPQNMEPGTYFNLILLQQQEEDIFLPESTPIGVIDTLSHLVVLHIADPENSVFGISTDFAQINLDITQRGIPFLRPMKVKYLYQNITNYVLSPMGEIQVFNEDSKYPPVYIKINNEEEKLYPGEMTEEELEVEFIHISDLFATKRAIGRFYNGIDENFIILEVEQKPNYILPLIVGATILLAVILLKSFTENRGKKRKKKSK